ncbi:hypothetical protein PIB30_081836 [Stylosanthes scabra]|uniref:SWIRM domain-containing protein n=1 Tax=Stylosanthes scabra TaxID=79078 RepID=A0ABU6SSJ1_9FABA|nr:hypothetical protein [Stylosanthes scabra]
METTSDPPQLPPPPPPPISPENDAALSPNLNNSSENQSSSLPKETTPETAVLESPEDSSSSHQHAPPDPDPNPAAPGPPRKRRRRKKFFTELNGAASIAARNRRNDVAKDCDVEALIAISVGFPVDSLTEEEIEANVVSVVGGSEQSNYIVVRNHILALWRSNVGAWLTRDRALQSIRSEHKGLVDTAYRFLLEHGYINFGIAPPIKEAKLKALDDFERGTVIVIGAGLAGLVAARQLVFLGFKVAILEGRMRPGGRVKTKKMKGDDGVEAAADFGGSVLTGINGNPLGVLARQLGLPLHKVRDLCPLQEFRGDMVLCTVPLGVLKKGSIEFVPELPQRKKDAIHRLGFGLLNKVAILFPYNFWGGNIDTFGHLTEDLSMRGEFFLFYSYSSVSGGALLVALVAGDAAIRFEMMSPVESVRRVLDILKDIYNPKGIVVPEPVQAVCTRWGKDHFAYGSYSYVAVGSSGDDYDILAESVGNGRLFFAGEATSKQYPATMHGAFLSGMREAANILRVANRRSLLPVDRTRNTTESDDLNKLFMNPDLKFGSFSALFNPKLNDLDSIALLRVKIGGAVMDSGNLYLYAMVSKKQVIELSQVDGDENRMSILSYNFGVSLVGRKGLSSAAESIIGSIKLSRSNLIQAENGLIHQMEIS